MHKGRMHSNGRTCDVYDSYEEVAQIAYLPPKYCDRCGTELVYCSFMDSMNRFTLKAHCRRCGTGRAVSVKKDKYEERMLNHWSERVKERAEYKCEMASAECSGALHAHHIIPKHLEPNRKYDVENGICLCEAHHKKIHHYM